MLRSLAAGDIILPAAPRFTCEGEGLVGIGRVLLRVRYGTPSSLEIIELGENVEPDELEDDAMDDAMDEIMEETIDEVAGAADSELLQDGMPLHDDEVIDSTPLTLDFQLGHLELTLGALRTLTAGVILPVEGGMPASVAITCGRRAIGRGEIVDVDGQLGIRITEWGTP
jgi:type III secretion protein Q